MKIVVAVSGGVDSVVLLDMLVQCWNGAEGRGALGRLQGVEWFLESTSVSKAAGQNPPIVVAHFDHGIRDDSILDAQFVERLAKKHGLPFEMRREDLGRGASEELARERRYAFLREVAKKHKANIVTAHHMDDVAETVAINITRGTGWRGAAVMASDTCRPLLGMTKSEIIAYANKNGIAWREDSTNASGAYLRNRLRNKITDKDLVLQLAALRARQVELRDAIDREAAALLGGMTDGYSRYFFTHINPAAARELLRAVAVKELGHSLPRPQLERLLLAIKTARPGSVFPFGPARLRVDRKIFTVKTP